MSSLRVSTLPGATTPRCCSWLTTARGGGAEGHRSWAAYIAAERFPFSRQRSYGIIDQARAEKLLTEATGEPQHLTARETEGIKVAIRPRVDTLAEATPAQVRVASAAMQAALAEQRQAAPKPAKSRHGMSAAPSPTDRLRRLRDDLAEYAEQIDGDALAFIAARDLVQIERLFNAIFDTAQDVLARIERAQVSHG